MLNRNNPRSAHIIAASNQLGFILTFAKNMTLATGKQRSDLYLIVEPAFAALRWLNEHRFENSTKIANRISYLQMMLRQLADMGHEVTLEPATGRKECPVCGSEVTLGSEYSPQSYCSTCLHTVMPAYRELGSAKDGFGTVSI
jgi:hypothetical protein